MLKGLHDVPIIFGRGKKISVVFVSQGIGHTSHHLLIGSLHLRSEFLDGSLEEFRFFFFFFIKIKNSNIIEASLSMVSQVDLVQT